MSSQNKPSSDKEFKKKKLLMNEYEKVTDNIGIGRILTDVSFKINETQVTVSLNNELDNISLFNLKSLLNELFNINLDGNSLIYEELQLQTQSEVMTCLACSSNTLINLLIDNGFYFSVYHSFEGWRKNSLDTYFSNIDDDYMIELRKGGFFNQYESGYGLEYLSYKMVKMPYLEVIDLSNNEMNDYGLISIVNTFYYLPNIIDLTLSYNNITFEGMKYFSNSLKWIKQLRKLDLYCNDISTEGIIILSNNLHFVKNLNCLNVGNNKIEDEGVICLCDNLDYITNLTMLCLNENKITRIGGDYICENITKCAVLKDIEIKENSISNKKEFFNKVQLNHPNKYLKVWI